MPPSRRLVRMLDAIASGIIRISKAVQRVTILQWYLIFLAILFLLFALSLSHFPA